MRVTEFAGDVPYTEFSKDTGDFDREVNIPTVGEALPILLLTETLRASLSRGARRNAAHRFSIVRSAFSPGEDALLARKKEP